MNTKKTAFHLGAGLLMGFGVVFGQVRMGAFQEGREIRYPQSFDVQQSPQVRTPDTRTSGPSVATLPVVTPSDFATRNIGSGVQVQNVRVSGRVLVTQSHDGSQIVTLRGNNGVEFRVATGTYFKMAGHVFLAEGFREGNYQVRNARDHQVYYFIPNR